MKSLLTKIFTIIIMLVVLFTISGCSKNKNNKKEENNYKNRDTIIEIDGEEVNLSKLDSNSVTKYYGKTITTIFDYMGLALYYVDYEGEFGEKGTVYLKATEGKNLYLDSISNLHMDATAIEIMKQLNPDWNKNRGDIEYSKMQTNEKLAVYFNNPEICAQIKEELEEKYGKGYINYVIVAPSVELFAKSFNACGNLNGINTINVKWVDESSTMGKKDGYEYVTGYNQLVKLTGQQKEALTEEQKQMLYQNGGMQWFSSPMSSIFNYGICSINENGESGVSKYAVACPVVSIRPGAHIYK